MTAMFLFLSGVTIGAWWSFWVQKRASDRRFSARLAATAIDGSGYAGNHEHDWEPVDAHRVDGGAITWTAIYCSDCGLYRAENRLGPGEKLSLRFPVVME